MTSFLTNRSRCWDFTQVGNSQHKFVPQLPSSTILTMLTILHTRSGWAFAKHDHQRNGTARVADNPGNGTGAALLQVSRSEHSQSLRGRRSGSPTRFTRPSKARFAFNAGCLDSESGEWWRYRGVSSRAEEPRAPRLIAIERAPGDHAERWERVFQVMDVAIARHQARTRLDRELQAQEDRESRHLRPSLN
jgi:hypothetical protein